MFFTQNMIIILKNFNRSSVLFSALSLTFDLISSSLDVRYMFPYLTWWPRRPLTKVSPSDTCEEFNPRTRVYESETLSPRMLLGLIGLRPPEVGVISLVHHSYLSLNIKTHLYP